MSRCEITVGLPGYEEDKSSFNCKMVDEGWMLIVNGSVPGWSVGFLMRILRGGGEGGKAGETGSDDEDGAQEEAATSSTLASADDIAASLEVVSFEDMWTVQC